MEHRPIRDGGMALHKPAEAVHHIETPRAEVKDLLIVEDHPLMSEALSMTLTTAFGLTRVRCVANLAQAEASIRSAGVPDAVLLDLNLPDVKGVEGVISLKTRIGAAPLTVISAEVNADMVSAVMGAGACGYISKTMPRAEMIEAIARMWAGETVRPEGAEDDRAEAEELAALAQNFGSLTPQQMNILRLICQGRPNKIISYELSIAEATVKTHIAAIMTKINVSNRTQAALLANRARLFGR